jgi:hypothetical protein
MRTAGNDSRSFVSSASVSSYSSATNDTEPPAADGNHSTNPNMRKMIAGLVSSIAFAVPAAAQARPIPIEEGIHAIRSFRTLALEYSAVPEILSFCQIPEAFDAAGTLKRFRDADAVPFATRTECDQRGRGPAVPDGVYFESIRRRGDTLVFRATRKRGEALSTQEYTVTRVGRTTALRTSLCIPYEVPH